ncbi:MAG: hypothetical protein ABSA77_03515, partial [Thermoguttaceae bacterium]
TPKPPFTISKETTYLTEPLWEDGYVDYVGALNKLCREGVTPENNAAVPLWEAIGPSVIKTEDQEKFFQMLGIKPLPTKGDYLVSFDAYLKQIKSADETTNSATVDQQNEQDEQFEKALNNPWSEEQYPLVAGWLNANQKPLQKIHEAARRPKFYSPMISSGKYQHVINIPLDTAQNSRECARLLMAQAMYDIQRGKIKDAREDILACHRLARLEGQGPMLVEALVGVAIDGMACAGDVALAQSGKLSPRDAAEFRLELQKLPPMPKMFEKIDLSERLTYLDCVESIARYGPEAITALTSSQQKQRPTKDSFSDKSWQSTYYTIDWDTMLKMGNSWYDRVVEICRKPSRTERDKDWKKFDDDIKKMGANATSIKSYVFSVLLTFA